MLLPHMLCGIYNMCVTSGYFLNQQGGGESICCENHDHSLVCVGRR